MLTDSVLFNFPNPISVVRNSTEKSNSLLIGFQSQDKGPNIIRFDLEQKKITREHLKSSCDIVADITQYENSGKILVVYSTIGSPIMLIDGANEISIGNLPPDAQFKFFAIFEQIIHVFHSQGVMAFDMITYSITTLSSTISSLINQQFYPIAFLKLENSQAFVLSYKEEYYLKINEAKIKLNIDRKMFHSNSFVSGKKTLAAIEYGPSGIYVWDTNGERVLPELFNEDTMTVSSICISHDGKYIARGMFSGYLLIHEIASAEQVFFKRIHTSRITAICEWNNGFITGGYDGKLLFTSVL